jgi:hypothetical protein
MYAVALHEQRLQVYVHVPCGRSCHVGQVLSGTADVANERSFGQNRTLKRECLSQLCCEGGAPSLQTQAPHIQMRLTSVSLKQQPLQAKQNHFKRVLLPQSQNLGLGSKTSPNAGIKGPPACQTALPATETSSDVLQITHCSFHTPANALNEPQCCQGCCASWHSFWTGPWFTTRSSCRVWRPLRGW